jgi:hypothetical protein
VKRSSKRIGATVLAAATVGTVAVAATVAGLEVADYCDEKQSIHATESILYGTDEVFDMKQCIDEAKEELVSLLVDARDASIEAVINAFTLKDDAADVIHE